MLQEVDPPPTPLPAAVVVRIRRICSSTEADLRHAAVARPSLSLSLVQLTPPSLVHLLLSIAGAAAAAVEGAARNGFGCGHRCFHRGRGEGGGEGTLRRRRRGASATLQKRGNCLDRENWLNETKCSLRSPSTRLTEMISEQQRK